LRKKKGLLRKNMLRNKALRNIPSPKSATAFIRKQAKDKVPETDQMKETSLVMD
jgi:hypothetical protein